MFVGFAGFAVMIKRFVLFSALCATGSVWAQQSLDISEKDIASGAASARLSALARTAASSGKRVVVTAPQHLHGQIAAALAGGGKVDVVLRDGFYENVLVRVEDKVEEAPRPEPRPAVAAPPPPPAPAPARPVVAPAQAAKPPAPAPVEAVKEPPPPVEAVAAPPASPAPAPPVDLSLPPPVAPAPAAAPSAPPPPPAAIEEAAEAAPAATAEGSSLLQATEPGDVTPVRLSLERLYNDGRRIRESITPAGLKNGDLVYTGSGAAVVVRRDGTNLLRFWLEGELDLSHRGLEATGSNRFKVIGSVIR